MRQVVMEETGRATGCASAGDDPVPMNAAVTAITQRAVFMRHTFVVAPHRFRLLMRVANLNSY